MIITMNDILPNNKNNKHIQLKKSIISNATKQQKMRNGNLWLSINFMLYPPTFATFSVLLAKYNFA